MTGLPIRWRVTAAFCLALLVVLTLIGAFVYLRLDAELNQAIDRGLQARAEEIAAAQQRSPDRWVPAPGSTLDSDENPAQILRADGSVEASTAHAEAMLLNADQLRAALTAPLLVDRAGDGLLDESVRLLAQPTSVGGQPRVVVVGASLDEKREALSSLLIIGSLGLAAALLASGAAGYLVAGVALRPVEAMRRQADVVSDVPDQRLPLPRADDEIGRLGRTLNAMLDRIERARRAERERLDRERRFVADASHELRTPLTILKSEIEVALMDGRDVAELRAALVSAGEETDRLCRLTDDLLALARSDATGPTREPVDVTRLLAGVTARHHQRAAGLGRRILTTCPPTLNADLDPRLVERALTNLLDNALRHGAGDIHCIAAGDESEVRIAVRDHGPGFPEHFQPRALDRFSRADPGRNGAGAGLGLAIVQAVAQAHHGGVQTQNAHPGVRVQISIPLPDPP